MDDCEDFVMVTPDGSSYNIDESKHPDQLTAVSHYVDTASGPLRNVSLEIHDHPELRYKETHAHDVLTRFMADQAGWTVTRSAYGIATAFVAVYDSGRDGAVASFNAEYGRIHLAVCCAVLL